MERFNRLKDKGFSASFLSWMIAVIFIAAILSIIEANINRKSAMSLFVLIILGILLTQPMILIQISSLIDKVRGEK